MSLTIYFNGQYWCGLIEYSDEESNWVVREYIFGSEPKVEDIFHFINDILPSMLDEEWLAQNKTIEGKQERKKINPKRLQRMINKKKKQKVLSSKSQEAIRLQHEEKKKVAKKSRKERKELYLKEQFEKKQAKKREKHKGH
ncbi:YjdF family protein [Vagococcus fluvialis]|uniref:YjdF family protein n=1 Tax=Vagococcus fluvialis TaxID=2738 RepID=UPI001A8D5B15|nr:YjdF family protein [Vagococcus fluvialis]MBO0429738.1 YjdF family protein [Vagococcus fluvialis]